MSKGMLACERVVLGFFSRANFNQKLAVLKQKMGQRRITYLPGFGTLKIDFSSKMVRRGWSVP
jgi:hypothetical protein